MPKRPHNIDLQGKTLFGKIYEKSVLFLKIWTIWMPQIANILPKMLRNIDSQGRNYKTFFGKIHT